MSEIVILAVCFQLKQLKKQPQKNQSLTGLEYVTLRNRCNALSTELSSHMDIIFIYRITIIGYMTNSQLAIYPCGLIAQWIV